MVFRMTIEILGGYSDGYIAKANNFYVYQNPNSDQYIYIAADLDLCLGNTYDNMSDLWSGNYSTFPYWGTRPLTNQIMRVPELNKKFNQLLQELNTKLFNPKVVSPRITDLVNMIKEDAEWDRSLSNARVIKAFGKSGSDDINYLGLPSAYQNNPVAVDMIEITLEGIPLDDAVNGPTGHISLSGVREWFNNIYQNTTNFFSQQ